MKAYQTKQRKVLFSFFEANPHRQLTIEELAECVEGISVSAIYRNINQMVEEGMVQRFQKEGSRKFYYQYVGGDCAQHLHLQCSSCGVTLHVDHTTFNQIRRTIKDSINFDLDITKTVLFGFCDSCR